MTGGWRHTAMALLLSWPVYAAEGPSAPARSETALFAGGCFWCTQAAFDAVPGVLATRAGYAGGTTPNPRYEEVAAGNTEYREALEVRFDPAQVSYAELLSVFWRNIDPTDPGGQMFDRGLHYTTAIFYGSEAQRLEALKSREEAQAMLGKPIATAILPVTTFYPAEPEHQRYYLSQPQRYQAYVEGSQRKAALKRVWKTGAEKP